MAEVRLHLAETRQEHDGSWTWFCRCGISVAGYNSQEEARRGGDSHLAKANARETIAG